MVKTLLPLQYWQILAQLVPKTVHLVALAVGKIWGNFRGDWHSFSDLERLRGQCDPYRHSGWARDLALLVGTCYVIGRTRFLAAILDGSASKHAIQGRASRGRPARVHFRVPATYDDLRSSGSWCFCRLKNSPNTRLRGTRASTWWSCSTASFCTTNSRYWTASSTLWSYRLRTRSKTSSSS